MLALRTTQFAPPGGAWFFELDGKRFESKASFVDLECSVVAYLEGAKKPIPANLRAQIEDFMCRRLPAGNCIGEGDRIPGSVTPGYFDLLKNLEKLRRYAFVEARQAEQRAAVCRACQSNNFASCHSCNGLRDQTLRMIGGRRVLNLPYLGACVFFALPTYALVWLQGLKAMEGLPDNCWTKGPLK